MTEQVQAHTSHNLMAIIDHLPMAVAVLDQDRRVILANRMAASLTGQNQEALIGLVGGGALGCRNAKAAPEGCGFGPDCLKCRLRLTLEDTLLNRTTNSRVENTLHLEDGSEKNLRVTTLPLTLDDREVVLLAIEDITEIKRQEEALRHNEKLKAAVATAGAVCHQVNQPLQVIMGALDLLNPQMSPMEIAGMLKLLNDQLELLASITRKLMTINAFVTMDYPGGVKILDLDRSQEG